jgi:hypothetical protein
MKVDLSPQAITDRLKQSSELRDLCIALGGERLRVRLNARQQDTEIQTVMTKKDLPSTPSIEL